MYLIYFIFKVTHNHLQYIQYVLLFDRKMLPMLVDGANKYTVVGHRFLLQI